MRTTQEATHKFRLEPHTEGDGVETACAMTALSWVAEEPWSARPRSAHKALSEWVVLANDDALTADNDREELVRLGEYGVLNTWWVPIDVLLKYWSASNLENSRIVDKVKSVLRLVAAWKRDPDGPVSLWGVNLTGLELPGYTDLSGRDFSGANFVDVYFPGCNLAKSTLNGVDFTDATLRSANLDWATLLYSRFSDTDLRSARYSASTLWPPGFDPRAAGAVLV